MSVPAAIAFAILFPVTYAVFVGLAYWLGSLPRRSEFNELRREVKELRKEIAKHNYRTAHSN